ncbi:MAG: XkdX family protein [Mogibacterium sp.]|nr:XkdX family protein [Mogibacterium sp.]
MSKDYEIIRTWYEMGLWDDRKLKNAVARGKITASEYKAITGTEYQA